MLWMTSYNSKPWPAKQWRPGVSGLLLAFLSTLQHTSFRRPGAVFLIPLNSKQMPPDFSMALPPKRARLFSVKRFKYSSAGCFAIWNYSSHLANHQSLHGQRRIVHFAIQALSVVSSLTLHLSFRPAQQLHFLPASTLQTSATACTCNIQNSIKICYVGGS